MTLRRVNKSDSVHAFAIYNVFDMSIFEAEMTVVFDGGSCRKWASFANHRQLQPGASKIGCEGRLIQLNAF